MITDQFYIDKFYRCYTRSSWQQYPNIVNCMVYLTKASVKPEDDTWKGQNMSR